MAVSERAARGKEARKRAPRSSHRDWAPAPARRTAREVLAQQDASRVPELVPIRYGRMLASPFAFFRGAAAIMAADLGSSPSSGLDAQLCGDAHLSNFGIFAAPERRLDVPLERATEGLIEVVDGVKSPFAHQGRRVVEGQRLMAAATDIFLGWLSAEGFDGLQRDYYVRQLWDGKLSADVEEMGPKQLARYGQICGWTLARAHARSGDRVAIAAYLGGSDAFDESIADFAEVYADQNEHDYGALLEQVAAGKLEVSEGV